MDCRYAHPPDSVSVSEDGSVTLCMDHEKKRCFRDPCRYFHRVNPSAAAPEHLDTTATTTTQQHQQQQQQHAALVAAAAAASSMNHASSSSLVSSVKIFFYSNSQPDT